ncbi:VIT1/CCC1 transporter family protein [Oceanotoga sp. DSM 15011]|jgi:VIT1/CCC1 family predicted Fe2+/Mn2+ transporter|uniref:VIT1/CCC1 family predicted Fe2+/Mn2+ transporter n=1 Tax=Oceanotoga teriensis TaxID=515440 RepID=A0AA45HJ48_9BACT|nr:MULTISPECIES: VIT1/CCC1 transporter family protein [Oceanotoga]MDN5341283.1 vacuolar iron transporter family protein [Oceanotoga sp.]MDO7976990.1 VIT1/CCC1 transporter family protein [Oceanotoga teriensis]PWJ95708.1 VIT1/CCC1 family predicted Fe2+/Mn2+ transporter [Oceanotoga teriensis]UYO99542.1 VIT1/CCC1 transporter family protein [Oceanotoga sp. DSM 15011]
MEKISEDLKKKILVYQKYELTEYLIYNKIANKIKDEKNKYVLKSIAEDEKKHYEFWKKYTEKDVKPNYFMVYFYYFISRLFGLIFGIKLMEKGEEQAQLTYEDIVDKIPEAISIIKDEDKHENELINLIHEDKLNYVGSIVLGLNDALVELTGTLAGLTFALRNTNIIAISGLITGIAASFSMAASEFLSKRSDGDEDALKSSFYTGIAYILTVFFLILPYLLLKNYFLALSITLFIAVLIILIFNFYISVAKDMSFKKRFLEMFFISMGVSAFSFFVGYLVRIIFGIDI